MRRKILTTTLATGATLLHLSRRRGLSSADPLSNGPLNELFLAVVGCVKCDVFTRSDSPSTTNSGSRGSGESRSGLE
eukprot:12834828-Heterocapsa_arctica.AAC.1